MQKVHLILLHRPFVSEGHLHSASPSIPGNAFAVCAMAATKIVQLLRLYDRTFSIQHAPYLMSYATYVAATIHVRIAAQRDTGSDAHASLSTCLYVFNKNQETNWAVRRARTVILNLMKRMNVSVTEEAIPQSGAAGESTAMRSMGDSMEQTSHQVAGLNSNLEHAIMAGDRQYNHISPDLDMDAIVQSFIREQQSMDQTHPCPTMQGLDQSGAHLATSVTQNPPSAAPAGFDIGYAGPTWNMMDFEVDGSLEDMIFGFNGADVDGMW